MKEQDYESLTKQTSVTMNVGFLSMRKGTFIHIQANEMAVEVKMDDNGDVLVCISDGVKVSSFNVEYGE